MKNRFLKLIGCLAGSRADANREAGGDGAVERKEVQILGFFCGSHGI